MKKFIFIFIALALASCKHASDKIILSKEDYLKRSTPQIESKPYDRVFMKVITTGCFLQLIDERVEHVFYTLNQDGAFSDMAMYPIEKTVPCFEKQLTANTITEADLKPNKPIHIHFNLTKKPTISLGKE